MALFFSLIFYAWGAPQFVLVLIAIAYLNFLLVRLAERQRLEHRRKILFILAIGITLLSLLYYKYFNFIFHNLNGILFQLGAEEIEASVVSLPIGISFFTFQSITYIVDIYRKDQKQLLRFGDYLLYIMLFPQMIAGPIVRFSEVSKELISRNISLTGVREGWNRFVIGLSKKVLIANSVGAQADLIFQNTLTGIGTLEAWVGILAYSMQIYFDFSGYSDMAIGLGRMLGFRFPENFNYPYLSRSITEFWKRWHMTLGTFMRDYLYIPMGGNRVSSNARLYFNLTTVFVLSGLWHGAAWNFLFWGLFHGAFLVFDRVFLVRVLAPLKGARVPITFLIVIFGWVLFRLNSAAEFSAFYSSLLGFANSSSILLIEPHSLKVLGIALLLSFLPVSILENVFPRLFRLVQAQFGIKDLIVLGLFLLCAISIVGSDFNPFIYYRF